MAIAFAYKTRLVTAGVVHARAGRGGRDVSGPLKRPTVLKRSVLSNAKRSRTTPAGKSLSKTMFFKGIRKESLIAEAYFLFATIFLSLCFTWYVKTAPAHVLPFDAT
jgi:hypothetical protein